MWVDGAICNGKARAVPTTFKIAAFKQISYLMILFWGNKLIF